MRQTISFTILLFFILTIIIAGSLKLHKKSHLEVIDATSKAPSTNHNSLKSLLDKDIKTPIKSSYKDAGETVEPIFNNYLPVKGTDSSLGKILSDIESHMDYRYAAGNYRDPDPITHSHETQHGISSVLRRIYSPNFGNVNCFYCLNNKVCVIKEPNVTISMVAKLIPLSLRGDTYNLYFVTQTSSWDSVPLYICDEWNAYIAGSLCRKDLSIKQRSETVQYMMEFDVYTICLIMSIKQYDPSYNDQQLKTFVKWNIEKSISIYNNENGATSYLNKFKYNPDANSIRQFSKKYFGENWCKKYLGI